MCQPRSASQHIGDKIGVKYARLCCPAHKTLRTNFYRPHPKDGARYCFHRRLSVHTRGGGTPVRSRPIPNQGRYPPDRAADGVLGTRRAVCLLRSFTQEGFLVQIYCDMLLFLTQLTNFVIAFGFFLFWIKIRLIRFVWTFFPKTKVPVFNNLLIISEEF